MENNINQQAELNYHHLMSLFLETRDQIKATGDLLDRKFLETDRKFQETDRQMRNLMKKMEDSESRWSKFVESLVEGSIVKLFRSYGINVNIVLQRVGVIHNNRQYEFDLIAKNADELIVVEVKTTLRPKHIKEFLTELADFKDIFKEWSHLKVYGSVAYINADGNANTIAEKKGLFIIKATGDSATIINKVGFKPNKW